MSGLVDFLNACEGGTNVVPLFLFVFYLTGWEKQFGRMRDLQVSGLFPFG
jgi:hypothetical protein